MLCIYIPSDSWEVDRAKSSNDLKSELLKVTMKDVVFSEIKPSSYFTGGTLRFRYRALLVNSI
jgi:hypothetical protein